MSTALEVTVKTEAARDDGETQTLETVITLNWDHITSIAPRVQGGCVLTLASGRAMITKETRAEINKQICDGGLVAKLAVEAKREAVKADLKPIKPNRKKKTKARA